MMKRVLKEDTTITNNQNKQVGRTSNDLVSPNTVGTILAPQKDNSRAPKLRPYPLDRVDNITTDIFIQLMNLMKVIEVASNNPAISKKYSGVLKGAHYNCKKIAKDIVDISNKIDIIE